MSKSEVLHFFFLDLWGPLYIAQIRKAYLDKIIFQVTWKPLKGHDSSPEQSEQNSPHLEQIGQHDEGLLSDDCFVISQTGWDVGDVEIHNVGVSDTQITHDHHHIIAHRNFCANL